MGVIYGEWVFPNGDAPSPDAVVDALGEQTGLVIERRREDDGSLARADLPMIKESLFGWDRQSDRISVHSFIPAHPYLWAQLNTVMTDLGGRISDAPHAWRPESPGDSLNRRWSELSKRQRFILRLPTIGAWRPLDFLAERD